MWSRGRCRRSRPESGVWRARSREVPNKGGPRLRCVCAVDVCLSETGPGRSVCAEAARCANGGWRKARWSSPGEELKGWRLGGSCVRQQVVQRVAVAIHGACAAAHVGLDHSQGRRCGNATPGARGIVACSPLVIDVLVLAIGPHRLGCGEFSAHDGAAMPLDHLLHAFLVHRPQARAPPHRADLEHTAPEGLEQDGSHVRALGVRLADEGHGRAVMLRRSHHI